MKRIAALILAGVLLACRGSSADDLPLQDSPLGEATRASFPPEGPEPVPAINHLAIISSGYDALLLRVHLIRQARHTIDIQTFIWTNDECGSLIMYELVEAARRGVKIRIIADHMVSERDPGTAAFLSQVHTNLEIRHYRPALARMNPSPLQTAWAGLTGFRDLNQRMHNKVMVFDGAALITGGRNIENTYYDHSTELNFRDRDVLAIGPVARRAAESFERFWAYKHTVPSLALSDVRAALETGHFRRLTNRDEYGFGPFFQDLDREANDAGEIRRRIVSRLHPVQRVTFIADAPGKSHGLPFSEQARSTRALKSALEQAETSIVMQTPYLVLSKPARQLLRKLKKDHPGLRIRISSNSFASTDNLLAYSANYRLRGTYVESLGLEIHEFRPQPAALLDLFTQYPLMEQLADARIQAGQQTRKPFLCVHAKSLVVDDRIAFVGSYNLDPRSENLNTEVGLLVEDEAFARSLSEEIERDMEAANSWVIAKRAMPLGLDVVNGLIGGLVALTTLDIWPIQNTTSFELKPGAQEVPPDHPDFYRNYRELDPFPGADSLLSQKEILTRLYKAFGAPLTPVL